MRSVMVDGDHRPRQAIRPTSAAERIRAAQYPLLVAGLGLAAGVLIWDVPAAFGVAATGAVVLAAALFPHGTAAQRNFAAPGGAVADWPPEPARAVLDALPRAGFILDGNATVRHANPRAGAMFPATRTGDPFTFTFRAPEVGDALRQAQGGRASISDHHEPGAPGSAYSVSISPFGPPLGPGEHGGADANPRPVLVLIEDVSERLALDRMRADFVANASHELRTPLASLTGFIETLLGPARHDTAAHERFLQIMLDQARRMRRLIDDLLSLSRVEMRVHRRPTDPVDLGPVLSTVRDALGPLADEYGVSLDVRHPVEPAIVAADRDELVQVFQNLIENAIRYGASGKRVEISCENTGPNGTDAQIAVHVQDYGPGIAAEHLPRLTERFYRVDVGASREMKGTGLGLAIVKHILVRHVGRLDVQSRPGEGARFTVVLPRFDQREPASAKLDAK